MHEIEAIFVRAEQFRESGNIQSALQEYTKVVYYAPRHWPAYFHLGTLFGNTGKNELAIALLKRAETLNPKNAVIKNHLADYLTKTRRHEEALALLKQSLDLDPKPTNISAAIKIGKLYIEFNQPEKALPYFELCLEETNNTPENQDLIHASRWFRGLCHLSLGDYQAAWPDYESRSNLKGVITPQPPGILWTGESLIGKKIFFAYEQRFGDFIQFIRFLPLLEDMGAEISVHVPPELSRQIRHSYPSITVVPTSEPYPEYDYHQLITSIPAVLNLRRDDIVKFSAPFLGINLADKVDLPTRNDTFLKVGFVWAGQPEPDRSIPLKYYIPLLEHNSVSFFSFQLGNRRNELKEQSIGWLVYDLAPQISDFYDSSILLKEMDLLITIDTAIAHQAGALNIPVWVMLLNVSDWRWENDCDDNIWYPSMRLFRQDKQGSWEQVAKQLESAFTEWVKNKIDTQQALPL